MAINEKIYVSIPKITHPLGKHWDQPKTSDITLINDFALMSENTLKKLGEYSASMPTGVYEGKMWKCQSKGIWYLRWFSYKDEKYCSTNNREIRIR